MNSEKRTLGLALAIKSTGNEALGKLVSSDTLEALQSLSPRIDKPLVETIEKECFFTRIHPSWITPILEPLNYADRQRFLPLFPQAMRDKLSESLETAMSSEELNSISMQNYLNKYLRRKFHPPIPIDLLPNHPLNVVLTLDRVSLHKLFYQLSMYDLISDLSKIIQSKTIKATQSALTQDERAFLIKVKQEREWLPFASLGLSHWNLDKAALRQTLLIRGMNRLAKSLFGAHPGLRWYISRRMNKLEAERFNALTVDLFHQKAHDRLQEQVLEAYNSLQTPQTRSSTS
jgi:hypothetical protein